MVPPPPSAGPTCPPRRRTRGRRRVGTVDWLRVLELMRSGQPACRVPGAYLRHAPRGGEHEAVRSRPRGAQSFASTTPTGGSCRSRAASWPCPTSRCVSGEATDLAVAQAVVDEREEMTRRGDASDVATPPGADTGLDRGDLRVTHRAGDGFDRRPAQQPGSLLGDVAAWVWASDSRSRGVSPAHEHNRRGLSKRVTSPISATNTAASTGPTPRNAWIAS